MLGVALCVVTRINPTNGLVGKCLGLRVAPLLSSNARAVYGSGIDL